MNKIKVFIDFDNTLVNSNQVAINYFNKKFNKNEKLCDLKRYDFSDLFPEATSKDVCDLFNGNELFDNLEFIEDCHTKLYGIRKFIDVDVVSIGSEQNGKLKIEWARKNTTIVNNITIIDSERHNKSAVDMSDGVFIDDHIECLRSSNAKIKILYRFNQDGDWNKYDNIDKVYIVNTWDEIIEILKFYVENEEII